MSWLIEPLHFFLFFPTDQPTIIRDEWAMGNETFYWDGFIDKTVNYKVNRCAILPNIYLSVINPRRRSGPKKGRRRTLTSAKIEATN